MNYGALVWGSAADYHLENITKMQKRAIKIIKFIKAREHVDSIFKNNHILPFKALRNFCMCKFFWKFKNRLIQIPQKISDDQSQSQSQSQSHSEEQSAGSQPNGCNGDYGSTSHFDDG